MGWYSDVEVMRLTEDMVKHTCILYYGMLVELTCQCVAVCLY